jgi:hypothetical protein
MSYHAIAVKHALSILDDHIHKIQMPEIFHSILEFVSMSQYCHIPIQKYVYSFTYLLLPVALIESNHYCIVHEYYQQKQSLQAISQQIVATNHSYYYIIHQTIPELDIVVVVS